MNQFDLKWNFDNSYITLPDELYAFQNPANVRNPISVLVNHNLSKLLGLSADFDDIATFNNVFSGNKLPTGAEPIAQAYAGHQFGHFTMLGDGRAILLGEHLTPDGKRVDIQLKGSGRTPYSRGGDGRATLYSMLREYMISEAMYYLGIPTSRSLAVVKTGEPVYRQKVHPGAVLTRIMSSHIRVGTFEYIRQFHPMEKLRAFTDYVIYRHYPELKSSENPALELLKKVTEKQTELIVDWLRVGFIHGVMNTDNTSICAETFDYGPCAFMNAYHPKTVFSSIDSQGRYAYGNQPAVIQWNLAVFAGTLLPLIHENEDEAQKMAEEVIDAFPASFNQKWNAMMCSKIGIESPTDSDLSLIQELLKWMGEHQADYTNTFTDLREMLAGDKNIDAVYVSDRFKTWMSTWKGRLNQNSDGIRTAQALMKKTNPVVIPRNHLIEKALIEGENDNLSFFNELLEVLSKPYDEKPSNILFTQPPLNGDAGYQTFCGT